MGRFSIFKFRERDGKGVSKNEDTRPTLKNFFKQFARKFSHLLSLNLLMLLQVLPIIFAILAYLFIEKTPSQTSALFAPLYGASLIEQSGTSSLIMILDALPLGIPVYQPVGYWIIGGCALFLLLFNGWLSVGSFYVLRGLVRGEAVFVFSDFFYGIKRNLKQGFLFGLVDTLLTIVLVFDVMYYSGTVGAFWMDVLFWILAGITILYTIMRPYIYMMMITFDMKLRKMLKNALIFSALGIKRNLMAALGIIFLIAFHVLLMVLLLPKVIITVMIPLLYIFAAIGFMSAYAVYPVIDRYMIAPYRKSSSNLDDDSGLDDVNNNDDCDGGDS